MTLWDTTGRVSVSFPSGDSPSQAIGPPSVRWDPGSVGSSEEETTPGETLLAERCSRSRVLSPRVTTSGFRDPDLVVSSTYLGQGKGPPGRCGPVRRGTGDSIAVLRTGNLRKKCESQSLGLLTTLQISS